VQTRPDGPGGELAGGHVDVLPGGHGEVLRGNRGDDAGIELGSYFVERIAVNTGNRPGPARYPRGLRGVTGRAHRGRPVRDGAEPP
jgi:hypothetical protein